MAVDINNPVEMYHDAGVNPRLSLLKTIFLYQQHRFGKISNQPMTEAILFGLSSGPGFLYENRNNQPIILGSHSLDSLQDLATSTGTWINRRFSSNEKQAVLEMEQYLSVWKAPLFVTVPHELFPLAKRDEEALFRFNSNHSVTKCLVTSIEEENVTCLIHVEKDPVIVGRADFEHALAGYSNQWVDIIFPKKDISLNWLYGHSIDRHVQRFQSGWKVYGTSKGNMERFFRDVKKHPHPDIWKDVFPYSDSLNGDLGRSWYAAFLVCACIETENRVLEDAAYMYKTLSEYWKLFFGNLKLGNADRELMEIVINLEGEAVNKLKKGM